MRKLALEEARRRTEERGFRLLSPSYEGAMTKHRFACQKGHEWEARPSGVWGGRGCQHCSGNLPLTLEEARAKTEARGFRLVSDAFQGVMTKHRFQCGEGHEWEALPRSVWRRTGCPHCFGNAKSTLEEARAKTEARGFRLVSDAFQGVMTKHRFQCGEGHEWEALPDSVWRGNGCPHCSGKMPLTIDQAIARTEARGFRLVSPAFLGALKKHRFACGKGHEWDAVAASVWAGHGCPECSAFRSERTVRSILEEDFGIPTKKARPDWLRHRKGKPLELDGYQPDLRFAWEHQGIQHRRFDPFFHRGDERRFQAQKERDAFKREATALQGILLFEIPQTKPATREGIKARIEREAERLCLPFAMNPQFREMMAQAGLPM